MNHRRLPFTVGHYRATVAVYGLWNEGIPFPRKSDIKEVKPTEFGSDIGLLIEAVERTDKVHYSAKVPDDLMKLLEEFEKKYVILNGNGTIKRVTRFDKSQIVVDISN